MRRLSIHPLLRLAPALFPLLVSFSLPGLFGASSALAHSPEDSYSARADLRVGDQRGLRVRVWLEVPDSAQISRGEAHAAVARLAGCLELTLGGEPAGGSWRAGDDPKHGLSNGSHTLFALEFEPEGTQNSEAEGSEAEGSEAGASLDVSLRVGCFPEKDLAFKASARARDPWRVAEEWLPVAPGHGHDHGESSSERRARAVFTRDDQST